MMEQIKAFYINNRWARPLALSGLALAGTLLMLIAGGFPPWAWRFLVQILPQLPSLWAVQGSAILPPLIGLLLLSLSLFLAWGVIVLLVYKVLLQWWQDHRARQRFQLDLQEAERLAEQSMDAVNDDADLSWLFNSDAGSMAQPLMPSNRPYQRAPVSSAPQQVQRRTLHPSVVPSAPNPFSPLPAVAPSPATQIAAQGQPTADQRSFQKPSGAPPWQISPLPASPPSFAPRAQAAAQGGSWQRPAPMAHGNVVPARPVPIEEQSRVETSPSQRTPFRKQLRVVPPVEFDEEKEFEADKFLLDGHARYSSAQSADVQQKDISTQPTSPEWPAQPRPAGENRASKQPDERYRRYNSIQTEDLSDPQPGADTDEDPTLPIRREDQVALRRPADEVRTDPLPGSDDEAHMVSVRLVVGVGLDPGVVRKDSPNEDSLFAIQGMRVGEAGSVPAGLFLVADGMGGHANGREASKLAVQTISDAIVPTLLREASGTTIIDEESLFLELLREGVHRANLAIHQRNREQSEMMGTTLTAALVVDTMAYIANVGDSRTYLYRAAEGLRQLTRDHSPVAEMVEAGLLSPDEIYTHARRNQINRCLGERPGVKVDMFTEPVQPGDILLLCSDGLWEMVRDPDIAHIISSCAHDPTRISAALVQAALQRGGADNISVIVVGVVGSAK